MSYSRTDDCEACGRRMALKMSYGKMVCSSCAVTRSTCKNRPQSVIDSLIELGAKNGQISPVLAGQYHGLRQLQKEVGRLRAAIG